MSRRGSVSSGVSPYAVAALVGGGLAALYAATRTADASTSPGPVTPPVEPPGTGATDIDPGPPAVPLAGQAPLAPDGSTVLLIGDEVVFDIYPAFAEAALGHGWKVSLMSIKGATAKDIEKAIDPKLGGVSLPTFDVVVVSVGTNDAAKYEHPGLSEAGSWPNVLLLRAFASRGVVYIYPPAFNRKLLPALPWWAPFASQSEEEVVAILDEWTRPNGALGPKKGFFRIAPSWWISPKPELRDDGFLTPSGAKAVADELVFQLAAG